VNFYKRFVGDYLRDTAHLSLAEHGAYALLLDYYYASELPLNSCRTVLKRVLRCNGRTEHGAIDSILDQFWTLTPDGYINERARKELIAQQKRAESARENGNRGGRPKGTQKKPSGLPDGLPNGIPTGVPAGVPSPKASHSQSIPIDKSIGRNGAKNDGKAALWELGVSVLGEKNRALIGKTVKQHGEAEVGKALAATATETPADPKAYFLKCLPQPRRAVY
jgi:uncharacterized protein YdaU (DUF1376 family)